jgi:hypothetical protein
MSISRYHVAGCSREHLRGGSGLLDAFPSQTAFAKAPMLNTQAPYFYRFKLGNFEGTIVSDGTLPLGKPEDNFVGLTKPEMGKQLTDNFLPLENLCWSRTHSSSTPATSSSCSTPAWGA